MQMQEGWLSSTVVIAMMIGAPIWGKIGDMFGRKPAIIVGSTLIFLSGFFGGFSTSYAGLLVSRFLVGFGLSQDPLGMTLMIEWLPPHSRGTWTSTLSVGWAIGAILVALLSWLTLSTDGWKAFIQLISLPGGVIVILVALCVYESPRWLVYAGKLTEAKRNMIVAGKQNKGDDNFPDTITLKGHYDQPMKDKSFLKNLKDLASIGSFNLFALSYVWFIIAFCYYGVIFFSTEITIEKHAGGEEEGRLCNGVGIPNLKDAVYLELLINALSELPSSIVSTITIEYGRRVNIFWGFLLSTIFIVLLTCVYKVDATVQIVALFMYRLIISATFSVITIYSSEIFPTSIRGFASGYFMSVGKIGSAIAPFVGQAMIRMNLAREALAIFSVATATGVLFVFTSIPEKAGFGMIDHDDDEDEHAAKSE
jgi:MFS family permease